MKVLFLCVANSARSQIAEGVARSLDVPGVVVFSAGSEPTRVRAEAVQVLTEAGIDCADQFSKSVDDVPAAEMDLVVTLCAEERCPIVVTDAKRLHHPLPDPHTLDDFRSVRDHLRAWLPTILKVS